MTAQWALEMAGDVSDLPLQAVAAEVVARFADGASSPAEVPRLATFAEALAHGTPIGGLGHELRTLSHDGYLRGAMVVMAALLQREPSPGIALALARELMDALDPDLGVRLCRGVLALEDVERHRYQPASTYVTANRMLAEALLDQGDAQGALRHFEAMLSIDVDDARALRGWSAATRALERRGIVVEHRSRGLALLEGLDELELAEGFGDERYERQRPLGRGRHAVVYQAFDRHVGREVAIKRLLDLPARSSSMAPRVLEARFFAEARTLAKVRSPYVVALLDARPKRRFIAPRAVPRRQPPRGDATRSGGAGRPRTRGPSAGGGAASGALDRRRASRRQAGQHLGSAREGGLHDRARRLRARGCGRPPLRASVARARCATSRPSCARGLARPPPHPTASAPPSCSWNSRWPPPPFPTRSTASTASSTRARSFPTICRSRGRSASACD